MENSFADVLRIEGINAKGYGSIPKMVTRDRRISPVAKAIYAYFCSFCGHGNQAFPRRETIMFDLNISKNTYHKHLNMLKDCGYIKITQKTKNGRFLYNIFTLIQNPISKIDTQMQSNNTDVDVLQVEGVNANGYGTIPKMVMRDTRLSPVAKAIYAYFCSFCGNGNNAFPRRTVIVSDLNISNNTYNKHLNMLKDCGYISVVQKRKSGQFLYNIFTIQQKPIEKAVKKSTVKTKLKATIPCTRICDTVNQAPCIKICDTVSAPCINSWDTKNCDTNNTNSIGNTNSNIYPSISNKNIHSEKKKERKNDFSSQIKNNIAYSDLVCCFEKYEDFINSITTLMIDVVSSSIRSYKIGGVEIEADIVKQRMLELKNKHIRWIIMTLGKNAAPVYNTRNYLLTVLFNAPITTGTEKFLRAKQMAAVYGE